MITKFVAGFVAITSIFAFYIARADQQDGMLKAHMVFSNLDAKPGVDSLGKIMLQGDGSLDLVVPSTVKDISSPVGMQNVTLIISSDRANNKCLRKARRVFRKGGKLDVQIEVPLDLGDLNDKVGENEAYLTSKKTGNGYYHFNSLSDIYSHLASRPVDVKSCTRIVK